MFCLLIIWFPVLFGINTFLQYQGVQTFQEQVAIWKKYEDDQAIDPGVFWKSSLNKKFNLEHWKCIWNLERSWGRLKGPKSAV